NPGVLDAYAHAVKNDDSDLVRLKLAHALSAKIAVPQVYDQMLQVGLKDRNDLVRDTALEAVETRMQEKKELREVFPSRLDRPNLSPQYHGLKGLMALNEPALKPRLIERAKNIIEQAKQSPMSISLARKTLDLLKRLDAQAARAIHLE